MTERPKFRVRQRGGKPRPGFPSMDLSKTGEGPVPTNPNGTVDAKKLLLEIRGIKRLGRRALQSAQHDR